VTSEGRRSGERKPAPSPSPARARREKWRRRRLLHILLAGGLFLPRALSLQEGPHRDQHVCAHAKPAGQAGDGRDDDDDGCGIKRQN